jgi:hypothetical protein
MAPGEFRQKSRCAAARHPVNASAKTTREALRRLWESSAFDPVVVLHSQVGSDEADQAASGGEDTDHIGPATEPRAPPTLVRSRSPAEGVRGLGPSSVYSARGASAFLGTES